MRVDDRLLNTLKVANLRGVVAAGTTAPLSAQATTIHGAGLAPGRKVLDTVTGQVVEVVSATTVYLPVDSLPR
jgi:hypothetical protein